MVKRSKVTVQVYQEESLNIFEIYQFKPKQKQIELLNNTFDSYSYDTDFDSGDESDDESEEEYTTSLGGRSTEISNAQTNNLYADKFQPSISSTSL